MINRVVPVKQVPSSGDETISKCLSNMFLAIRRIHRATLADFGENNGVAYVKYHGSIIRITVLYEQINHITVLWLIQYSYAVDYYFMNYTALFRFDPPTQSTIYVL